jgi:hypothetical protein
MTYDELLSIECENSDIQAQLHALARLAPSAPQQHAASFDTLFHSASFHKSNAASMLYVTSTMPTEADVAALLAAIRGTIWRDFTLLVVDLGVQMVDSGDVAALLSLMAAETVATSTLCSLARVSPAELSDALVSQTIAKSPRLSLAECTVTLSCDTAVSVQVRRAFAPPIVVAAARVCRCHHAPVAVHGEHVYCSRTAQIDRFDVIECIDVGGKLVLAPKGDEALLLASDATIDGPLIACALAPIDMARVGGSASRAPFVVVPHVPARQSDDLLAAMAAVASNSALFAALVGHLVESGSWLIVRSADERLFALCARAGVSGSLVMHEYLPRPALLPAAGIAQSTSDNGATISSALQALRSLPPVDAADNAFARWRQEHALAPLMQAQNGLAPIEIHAASGVIATRTQQAALSSSSTVAPRVVTKKRALHRAKLNL